MPYIDQKNRAKYNTNDIFITEYTPCGDLNYVLTTLINKYLGEHPRYQRYCEVEGVLGHIAKELYRRRAVPYEEEKIAENGDVF